MFARVIPSIRAPRRLTVFDYAVPFGITVAPGDLVLVPFRSKNIVGIVSSVSQTLENPNREVKEIVSRYGDLRLSDKTLKLLDALAVRSFSSPAHVLHAWIGAVPKRSGISPEVTHQTSMIATHEIRLLRDRWHTKNGIIETALHAKKEGKRVLILTPWADPAETLAKELNAPALTSGLAAGARFKAWAGFLRGEHPILVATRVGAWLSTEADVVILDEPENDDHKQDELAPRYDTRWVVDQAQKRGTSVIEFGLTPRLGESSITIPTIDVALHAIDTHPSDWSAIAGLQNRALNVIEEVREAGKSTTIIHPIHGDRARLRCADCGWTAVCTRCGAGPTLEAGRLACHRCGWKGDAISDCPSCGSVRLSKSRPGRDTLVRDLASKNFTNVRVVSIGEWNASPVPKDSLVVLTDLSLLSGGVEDLRRRERLIIAFRRLADACAANGCELVVQSDSQLLNDARTWLIADGCAVALDRELAERKTFELPPATRLVKLIVRGPLSDAQTLASKLPPHVPTLGPYEVERLPGSRMPRSVIQLIFPLKSADAAIQRLLEPLLSDNVLVDLDPVAFFE